MNPVDRIIKEHNEAKAAGRWVTVDISILIGEIFKLRKVLTEVKECIDDKSYIDAEMMIDNALQQKDT